MAKSTNFFDLNKKIGPIVFRRGRNGFAYVSRYQRNVANPNTELQKEHRQKMQVFGKVAGNFKSVIRYGFTKFTYTAYAEFSKLNFTEAITGTYPQFKVGFDKLKISNGNVELPYSPVGTLDGSDISCTWSDNSGLGDADAADKAVLAVYNPAKDQLIYKVDAGARSDRSAVISTPAAWSGDTVEGWMFMRRDKQGESKDASPSFYLGSFNL